LGLLKVERMIQLLLKQMLCQILWEVLQSYMTVLAWDTSPRVYIVQSMKN